MGVPVVQIRRILEAVGQLDPVQAEPLEYVRPGLTHDSLELKQSGLNRFAGKNREHFRSMGN